VKRKGNQVVSRFKGRVSNGLAFLVRRKCGDIHTIHHPVSRIQYPFASRPGTGRDGGASLGTVLKKEEKNA